MPDSSLHFANLNESNYAEWSLYMQSMLIKKGLWKVVEGSETCLLGSPNSKAVKAFERHQAEAHAEIVLCQELNYSGATPDSFPTLLRPTFPHYSGVHSRATPVHTPVLLQSTTGLDQTPLDLPFNRTRT